MSTKLYDLILIHKYISPTIYLTKEDLGVDESWRKRMDFEPNSNFFFWSNLPFHKNLSNNRVCHLKEMVRELKQRVLGQSIRWFITCPRNKTKGDR